MAPPEKLLLRRRAVIAVTLTIGFYLMIIALGSGVAAVTYWLCHRKSCWDHESIVNIGVFLEIAIFFAALPPLYRRRQPGVPLNPERQPELFDRIAAIAGYRPADAG
jgi:hypothetical protein